MSATEISSTAIAAPGGTITLANGEEIQIRYGMRAIKQLEDDFGSINSLVDAIGKSSDGAFFTTISKAVWAGTSRVVSYDDFIDLLDPRRLTEYVTVFATAIGEALGTGEAPAAEKAAEPAA